MAMQKVIVLLGVQCDRVLQYYASYLKERDIPAIFINQNRLGVDIYLDGVDFYLPDNQVVIGEQISGVLNRSLAVDGCAISRRRFQAMEILYDWLDWVHPNVINRPKDTLSNWSKPYQLSQGVPEILQVPESVLVRDNTAPTFQSEMIYKSISACRSIVVKYLSSDTSRSVTEPVLFQQYISGEQIRVHVIAQQVVAVHIESQAIDYRYDHEVAKISALELEPSIIKACVALADYLDLVFAGIDLIRSQGQYYYLESNPSPGYACFEQGLGETPISDLLTKRLCGSD